MLEQDGALTPPPPPPPPALPSHISFVTRTEIVWKKSATVPERSCHGKYVFIFYVKSKFAFPKVGLITNFIFIFIKKNAMVSIVF